MTQIFRLKPGRFAVDATPELVAALADYGIQFTSSGGNRFNKGDRLRFSSKTLVERYSGYLLGDVLYSLGAFSYSRSELHPKAQVGRYCSIAEGVANFGASHPLSYLSSSPFFYDGAKRLYLKPLADAGLEPRKVDLTFADKPLGIIENDVWIGDEALIGGDLTIGTGAVIAARAVVTKDVEPYSIMAGVPARIVRKRFPDALIERLLASRWWDYNFTQFYDLPFEDPSRFLDAFDVLRDEGRLVPLEAPRPFLDVLTELGFALDR
jgi:acetyltransferase-like isoleucine patch superfamily enzyme